MSRFARQVDANQALIVKGLKLAGASVSSTSNVAGGFGDLCVGVNGFNFLLEVKNPNRDPCKRKLRPLQTKWADEWKGQKAKVETLVEALKICGLTLPDEKLIQLALEKAKGVVDGAGWVKAAAWGSRAVGIALPFQPLPSPAKPRKSGGPFRRKGKGTSSPPRENFDVGRTPTDCVNPYHEGDGHPPRPGCYSVKGCIHGNPEGVYCADCASYTQSAQEQSGQVYRPTTGPLPTSGGGR